MDNLIVNTGRIINELKSGRPIIIADKNSSLLIISSENISDDLYDFFLKHNGEITLSKNRTNFIKQENNPDAISLKLNLELKDNLFSLIGEKNYDKNLISGSVKATDLQKKALELLIIAELIPSCISCEKFSVNGNYLSIDVEQIDNYDYDYSNHLKAVCKSPLTLKNSINSSIIGFVAPGSVKEHYAIIIGNPAQIPLIRVHSACYTGDLLSSLTCDCEDQLHSAITKMNHEGGGIILYLMQEGRNIGLINKLRAYNLKEQGLDTVDANLALGFNEDDRSFRPAAKMLQLLGYKKIQLLTNNPDKARILEQYGIVIDKCVGHVMSTNKYNRDYLKTKQIRLGHRLNLWQQIKRLWN